MSKRRAAPLILKPVYQDGQLLGVADFNREQALHIATRELQTRALCTPGILSGLAVGPGPALPGVKAGATIVVGDGEAFDSLGRTILLVDHARFNDADVPVANRQFVLSLDDARYYAVGETRTFRLGLTFREEVVPDAANQARPAPILSVVADGQSAPETIALADLVVEAHSTTANPPVITITITIDPRPRTTVTIAQVRVPPIATTMLTGLVHSNQLEPVPASKIAGQLTVDQLPAIPADKVAGFPAIQSLFTAGLLSDLGVRPGPDVTGTKRGSTIAVDAGAALDPSGRMIMLADHAQFNGADVEPTNGVFVLSLDDARYFAVGETRAFRLGLTFAEEPVPGAPNQVRPVSILSLVPPDRAATPTQTVVLADLIVTATSTPPPPPATTPAPSGQTPPPVITLHIAIDRSAAVGATLAPIRVPPLDAAAIATGVLAGDRIPPIATTKLTGLVSPDQLEPLPTSKITGQLTIDQLPAIPASKVESWPVIDAGMLPQIPAVKITGPLAIDQLPPIPAPKITGPMTLDQLPAIPASKIENWAAIDAAMLPQIPAAKIAGPLSVDQIPVVPTAKIPGPLGPDQVPLLNDILRRLADLEGRLAPQVVSLSIVDGDQQKVSRTGTNPAGGSAAFAPLRVRASDASGKPVPNARVEFTWGPLTPPMSLAIDPQGQSMTPVVTGIDGIAALAGMSGDSVVATNADGPITIVARTSGAAGQSQVTFNLTVANALHLNALHLNGTSTSASLSKTNYDQIAFRDAGHANHLVDLANTGFTMEASIYPEALDGERPIIALIYVGSCQPPATVGWKDGDLTVGLFVSDGHVRIAALTADWDRGVPSDPRVVTVTTAASVPLAQWSHISAVSEYGGMVQIFLNGQPQQIVVQNNHAALDAYNQQFKGLRACLYTFQPSEHRFMFGSYQGRYYRGYLADVKLWQGARPAADIQQDRHGRMTASEIADAQTKLLGGYWPLDEGTGTVAHDLTAVQNNAVIKDPERRSPL